MLKQANEAIGNSAMSGLSTAKPKYVPGAGLKINLGRSAYMQKRLAPRGMLMGTGPDGKTTYMEGLPIVNNNSSGTSDFVKRHILRSSSLGTGLGGTL